jgi:NAD(P)-dependent dehydrogenase (short-subunit alcohol dehydrogenase family)
MHLSLDGRVTIVTGAATGLGLAIADAFDEAGAVVIRVGRETAMGRANWKTVDVRDQGQVDAAVGAVAAEYGRLDIMINNAGVWTGDGSSVEKPPESWHEIIETNLDGTWFGCRAAIRQMLTQAGGGVVINMSSRLALSAGNAGRAAYVASKAAVSNLTRHLAVEYGRRGIRVNAICPGFVPGTDGVTARDPARIALAQQQTPATRLGRPSDVAAAALYLASDAAEFINGHNLVIDGGASVTP